MGNQSIIGEDELQDLVENVVADKLGNEDELDHEFNEEAPELNDEELKADIVAQDDYDVFEHKINPRVKAGDFVKIEVHKNGEMLGTERGIWSWEKIHQKYGGGHLKIKARSSNGRHVGQETRLLGELLEQGEKEPEKPLTAPQSDNIGTKDLFLMLNQMTAQAEEKAQRRIEESQKQNTSMMQVMITALSSRNEPKEDNTSSMLLEMQKMNMQMFEKMNEKSAESAKELRQEMRELVKEISASASKKDEGMSAFEMFKMMRESEESGRQNAQVMFDLVEQKAELIALRNGESAKDESLVDKVIGNLGSLLPMLANMKGPMAPAPAQPRRQLRPNKANPQRRANPNGARNQPDQVQRPQGESSEQGRASVRKNPLGMPTIVEPIVEAPEIVPEVVEQPQMVETASEVAENPEMTTMEDSQDEQVREQILEVAIPVIANGLMAGKPPEVASQECLSALTQHPFFTLEVEDKLGELFTIQMIYLLAEKSGLIAQAESLGKKAEVENWLREFHADLISKTREESELGESTLD